MPGASHVLANGSGFVPLALPAFELALQLADVLQALAEAQTGDGQLAAFGQQRVELRQGNANAALVGVLLRRAFGGLVLLFRLCPAFGDGLRLPCGSRLPSRLRLPNRGGQCRRRTARSLLLIREPFPSRWFHL